ncbi:hypothetical protein OAE23_02780 [Synechococcus sp. AH-551-E11]|nr:hypothetical protein [Synechococcus sp. AH-551-E11]MDB4617002.1 hypothetical protein [Synechococcus sp. AH-551-E11]
MKVDLYFQELSEDQRQEMGWNWEHQPLGGRMAPTTAAASWSA